MFVSTMLVWLMTRRFCPDPTNNGGACLMWVSKVDIKDGYSKIKCNCLIERERLQYDIWWDNKLYGKRIPWNHMWTSFLPPTTKLRQCNVFTPVCDSVHGGLCPGGSLSRRGFSVRGYLSGGGVCVQVGLCQGDPPPPYGYVRPVCILMECILVKIVQFLQSEGRIED